VIGQVAPKARLNSRSRQRFRHNRQMPNEHQLTLRLADQIRTDIANLDSSLEMIMAQVAGLPTRKELWRAALLGMLGGSALTTVLALAFVYHLTSPTRRSPRPSCPIRQYFYRSPSHFGFDPLHRT
jgi:hypothetical protein